MLMFKRVLSIILVLGLLSGIPAGTAWAVTKAEAVAEGIEYFRSVQNDDGGFPREAGEPSDAVNTSWVIMALTATGRDPEDAVWSVQGKSPVAYLLTAPAGSRGTTENARILLSLAAAGRDGRYQGRDLTAYLAGLQQENGQFYRPDLMEENLINAHIWTVLALASQEEDGWNDQKALAWLLGVQNDDGGFGWYVGGESDTDDTAAAVQALRVLGESAYRSDAVKRALAFMKSRQTEEGGFTASDLLGRTPNTASSAWVLQALASLGIDPATEKQFLDGSGAVNHLLESQAFDGAFDWKRGVRSAPVQITAYALMGLSGKAHPVNRREEAGFPDVGADHWAVESIGVMVSEGIMQGYPDGGFRPEQAVTREEFTTMMVKALGAGKSESQESLSFLDVPGSRWSHPYIAAAYWAGIIQGRSAEYFDPTAGIKGAELATMLVNGLAGETAQEDRGLPWYSGSVGLANEYGWLYPGFDVGLKATRAQCAYSIHQFLKNGF
jgi:prenyltransferase beta subunit